MRAGTGRSCRLTSLGAGGRRCGGFLGGLRGRLRIGDVDSGEPGDQRGEVDLFAVGGEKRPVVRMLVGRPGHDVSAIAGVVALTHGGTPAQGGWTPARTAGLEGLD